MRLFVLGIPALAFLAAAAPVPRNASGHPTHLARHTAPPDVTVFTNVNVVPMDREQVLTNQTVVIKAGHIAQIGPASRVHVPAGAFAIDGRGKYLMPGLADMHAHPFMGPHIGTTFSNTGFGEVVVPWADSAEGETRLFLWLANGVTTIRALDYVSGPQAAGDTIGERLLKLRGRAATGTEWLPHIYTAGQFAPRQYLRPLQGEPAPVLDSVSKYVIAYKAAGYDQLKVHDEAPTILDSIMVTAKRIGLTVVGHVPSGVPTEAVLPYYKSIEHPLTEYDWKGHTAYTSDTTGLGTLVAAMARAGVWNCPTLSHYDRNHYDWFEQRPPTYLGVLRDAGVKMLLGTDEVPWIGVITRELEAMVGAGLTPYQALQTGTSNVAEYFGISNESGTIAVGKRADLLLLTGNPLQDVRYTAQPAGVMLGGRWLSRADIDKRLATLLFPMPNPTDSVQDYWANVMREAVSRSSQVLSGINWDEGERTKMHALQATHVAQRKALIDSLGHNDQYTASTARVFGLVAQQFRDDRAVMNPSQVAIFDPKFTAWQERYKAQLH